MRRQRELESHMEDLGDRVRRHVDDASDAARGWVSKGRNAAARFGNRDYGRRISNAAGDFADEANYRYRRLRRQVKRHPVATTAIVAGTVGALLLLWRAFGRTDEE
ncbi:hypothetical protein [Dyella sp. A6]|uniref:hypothetical protein n=1 Tax=Dyella aluminiiresistens TaxID=3069105 RepID=UPI002E768A34|nr:hypothetical protein [Dyella sp. A6]